MEKKRKAAAEIFANQCVQQQAVPAEEYCKMSAEIDQDLSDVFSSPPSAAATPNMLGYRTRTSEELQIEKDPIHVIEKGFFLWKRVIIPPNVYVVHTRLGKKEPVTIGLGISFRYNPYSDAYLVVPSAIETIGVVANCITKEKQGINVLAYVQWQIDDFSLAYRRLDFSDVRDPLGIVNAQLGEQAEAAIKDKISTMSVEEVLTDKALVIEELTTRLKAVAEGRKQNHEEATSEGLGIKIITVQIREALVSSKNLWRDLQAPYRHQQQKIAQISELLMQSEIKKQQLETEQQKINLEEQTTVVKQDSQQRLHKRAATMEQERELQSLQREQEKTLERSKLEADATTQQKTLYINVNLQAIEEENRLDEMKVQATQQQLERETVLKKLQVGSQQLLQTQDNELKNQVLAARLSRKQQKYAAQVHIEEGKIELSQKELKNDRLRQEIRNLVNERDLMRYLIEGLPALAAKMPDIQELKVLQTGEGHAAFATFTAFIAQAMAVAESLGLQKNAPKSVILEPEVEATSET